MRITRDLRYIAALEAELERVRYAAISFAAFTFALILALAVVR